MNEHQEFEQNWWGDCTSTLWEEQKQLVYARYMGLSFDRIAGPGPLLDIEGKSILDVGGGPVSMLLKTVNLKSGVVLDPCGYPQWTTERYSAKNIKHIRGKGEEMLTLLKENALKTFDECWIYNVLQHTENPAKIARSMRKVCKVIRVFEWVDTGTSLGHPHDLKEDKLDKWFGGKGKVEFINDSGAYGSCYFGIFKGDLYEAV